MAKYLLKDFSQKDLGTREEVDEYLTFREANDQWIVAKINEVSAYGIEPELRFFWADKVKGVKLPCKGGWSYPLREIVIDDSEEGETNLECMEQFGLFLCVMTPKEEFIAYPCDERAFLSILQRCGDECGTMTRVNPSATKMLLPIEEKAQRIARDNLLYSGGCQILLRDGKVRFDASDQYTIANNRVLIEALENELKKEHPELTYSTGAVSHDYLVLKWDLADRMQEESLRMRLNDAGANIRELHSGVTFVTSDTGRSSVRALVNFVIDGKEITLAGVSIDHKEEHLEEEFLAAIEHFNSLMKESEEMIEELGNVDIMNIEKVVRDITANFSTIFPKKATEEVVSEIAIRYPAGGTAMDCYLLLVEIIDRFTRSENPQLTRSLELSEKVSGLMHLPFDKIELGEYEFPKKK